MVGFGGDVAKPLWPGLDPDAATLIAALVMVKLFKIFFRSLAR
jgi:hypothetical protein